MRVGSTFSVTVSFGYSSIRQRYKQRWKYRAKRH